jgi:nucleotide-binding universal stress UspA family protein
MKRIIAAVDFTDVTEDVIDTAVELCRSTGARLYLLHTAKPQTPASTYLDPMVPGGIPVMIDTSALERERLRQLEAMTDRLRRDQIDVKTLYLEGAAAELIADTVEATQADLVVLGSHDHGSLHHLLFGSVREQLLQRGTCPVLVVPRRSTRPAYFREAGSPSGVHPG